MTRHACLLGILGLLACPDPNITKPPVNPPQVFLTVEESNVIGNELKGSVNVAGCKNVTQVQLLQGDAFLVDLHYSASPTTFALPSGTFSGLYGRLGIAASLTLKAKVVCDDGRTNNSQPVGVKFFPIASRQKAPAGSQVVPDTFVAESGLGGSPTTFLGCARNELGGTQMVRVDAQGNLKASLQQLPVDCSAATVISDVTTSGYRWIFEPGGGAYALDMRTFTVGKQLRNTYAKRIGVSKSGVAVVWIDDNATRNRVSKMAPAENDTSNDWEAPFGFIMNSDPVIDEGSGQAVWLSSWEFHVGNKQADIVAYKLNINTGVLINGVSGNPPVILRQQYPMSAVSEPIMPHGFFSPTGDTFVLPILSFAVDNSMQTTIVSCSTALGLCEGNGRRWVSPTFSGLLWRVIPYSNNNIYAAVGPYGVYFLTAQLGTVLNLGERAIAPGGSQQFVAVQPGNGSDFYALSAPSSDSQPTEIVAVDTPQTGEVWRVAFGSGEASANALTMGIDDGNQTWLRIGADLVKPLTNNEYRMARGPTILP